MRLEPLYRIRFTYPESWAVGLDGGWQQLFFIAEGRCEGSITGRFRGANFPRKEGAEGPFRPDFRAVIEADDGAVIMVEWHGYGRAYPPGRRQIVGALFHLADREPCRSVQDGETTWTEWRWSGTRSDGQAFDVRGVTLFEIADGQIAAGRLYLEDVERDVAGIDQAVEALSGHRPRPRQ
jgi:hypothetical protein